MRISTETFFARGTNAMLDQQSTLSKTQMQLSTGRRILTPADDPMASEQAMELSQTLARTEQFNRNADQAAPRLELEEDVLDSVGKQLQRVRELAVQGSNATQTNETRRFLASEVRQIYDELINLANMQDGNGEYLFAGHKSKTQPFIRQGDDTVTYQGDQGQREILVGENRRIAVTDSGDAVFRQMRSGNGTFQIEADSGNKGTGVFDIGSVTDSSEWVNNRDTYTVEFHEVDGELYFSLQDSDGDVGPDGYDRAEDDDGNFIALDPPDDEKDLYSYEEGAAISFNGIQTAISGTPESGDTFTIEPSKNQDIFTMVRDLYEALETSQNNDTNRAEFRNDINNVLTSLGQGADKISETRAKIGARLNNIDDQRETNEMLALTTKEIKSKLEDLDYAEAISRLNQEMAGLQASQQVYTRLQNLSIFNYI